jgi:biotin carboxyl carrier protein
MPGLVVKVLCEPGQQVEAGQALVVLQAMKMENELSLARAGTVKEVPAQPGQTVDQGAILVVVE